MATEAEMMSDLEAADAAGDTALAQHIAGLIKSARGSASTAGRGDLQLAERRREVVAKAENVPAHLLTGTPIDQQRAEALWNAGKQSRPLTGRQAAQGMALVGSLVAPPLAGSVWGGGAIGGGLTALGTTKAHTVPEAAVDTVVGAAGGAAGAKALEYGSRAFRPLGEWLDKYAIEKGRKVLTGVSSPLARRKELPEEAIRLAYEKGAITPGVTVKTVANRLQDVADPLAERYGTILEELGARGVTGPNAQAFAAKLAAEGEAAWANSIVGTRADALKGASKAITGAPGHHMAPPVPPKPTDAAGNLGLMQTELMKRELQQAAANDFVKEGPQSLAGQARKELAGVFRQAVEESVASQASKAPEAAAAFRPVKEELHQALTALGPARESAARMARRSDFGLHEAMGMAAGVASGNPAEAIGAAGLMKALKDRYSSAVGAPAYRIGKYLIGADGPPVAMTRAATAEGSSQIAQLAAALRRRLAVQSMAPALADQDPRIGGAQ